ncbi:hypothetical protein AAAU22_19830 [[Clostridium] symbiosum]|jgi:fumarate hydratase class II|uniref:hypothetical protein n=1 Tax=Clostridium symbiosum TaxID=1512 RepID=UPI0032C16E49
MGGKLQSSNDIIQEKMGIIIGKMVTVQLSAKLQQMITETKKRRKHLAEYIMAELLRKK